MSNPNAARLGDDIIHTSVLADILEGAFEAAICVAVGVVVVAAAAPLAAAATCTAAGIIGGLTVSLSGAAEVVGDIARGAANFISPPFAQGKIATGSLNVQTNGLPAARAAGRLMTAAENATREKMEAEEKKRREEEEARMSTGMKVLNGVVALGAGKVYHAGSDRTERGVEPISLPIKSNINYRSLWIK